MRVAAILRLARATLLGLTPAALAGCYAYAYAPATPLSGQYVSLDLNDRGRVALVDSVGPSVARVEGLLASSDDSVLALHVARTVGMRGEIVRWNGESVTVRREYVGQLRERHLSTARTAVLAGSVAVGVGAFMASRGLFGSVTGETQGVPGGPPNGQ
jgi:hypothetical protein